ncbi:uncharacterized UDP-glucosyltransferase YjiC-like isoform X1 [Tetranychus urticae]|uniref:UDP-glycosyltransferase 204A1 n=1 Tax=Tetranychus urticae TaxID=32264 RepID=T1JV49_TETUR|nr:uncharacterized UDP-glucosyltransferase YjiC-like [Tetranychus urticae]XP_015794780.1 uncharacterized UDP-glucosyltransferase YjiC-like isoform X1 [Tetranychus urticae]AHX56902.1 UDP-glycosyltransferase 204A1 [Tetranychus urticae]
MNSNPIKVLVTSINGYGHFNAALGVASLLANRGNDVYFANLLKYKDEVQKYGVKFIALEDYNDAYNKEMEQKNETKAVEVLVKSMEPKSTSPLGDEENSIAGMSIILAELQLLDSTLQKIIDSIKPDILIGDVCFPTPLFYQSPIPRIILFSPNPSALYYETTGFPTSLGLSVHVDRSSWPCYHKKVLKMKEACKEYFKWLSLFGIETNFFHTSDKFLGIYMCPKALDYVELGSPPPNWIRIDSSIRTRAAKEFIVPPFRTNQSGKLVYLSMGTSGSLNIALMKRLINTFSKSKHCFIVSKGFKGDELTLSENMWGDNYVDQIAILPKVDAVITHGGNNSFIETFYFGKPMIVMPCCFDQLDNAQRIEDLKLGYRVDPLGYDEDEIHKIVDDLLENTEIRSKMEEISKQLKTSNNREEVARLIENIAVTKKYPFQ